MSAVRDEPELPGLPETAAEDRAGLFEAVRMARPMLFASAMPLSEADLATRLPEGTPVRSVLADLQATYAARGVNLVKVAGLWMFRTARISASCCSARRWSRRSCHAPRWRPWRSSPTTSR